MSGQPLWAMQIWVASAAPWSHGEVLAWTMLPRTMSGSMDLQRLGSRVVSMATVASKGSVDAWDHAGARGRVVTRALLI